MEEEIVIFIHIYGARSISLLFCDHQDIDLDYQGKIGLYQKIFNHKKYHRLYGEMIIILYKTGEEYCGSSSYLWS